MGVIDNGIVRLEILDSATEDISGLYEIIWRLNTLFPDISETTKILTAQPIVKSLLQTGLIELYKCNWDTNEQEIIPSSTWDYILSNDSNWNKPNDKGEYFAFFQTNEMTLIECNKQYKKMYG